MKIPEHLREIVSAAREQGWRMEVSPNGTSKLYPADGSRPLPLHMSKRPGRRSKMNARAQARRAGLRL